MRCPKCQYLGFEPSPRCKNCGYDFSFSGDDLPGLQIVSEEPTTESPMDLDLNVLDQRAAASAPARGFDLDDLLARARSEAPAPMAASRRERSAAAAVATPPAEDVFRMVAEEPVVAPPVSVPASAVMPSPVQVRASVREPEPAPLTSELPLFMQVMSEAASPKAAPVRVESPVATLEMAVEALAVAEAEVPAPVVEEIDDRPLVQVPAVPRAPLAVRRTTPDPARLRAKYARATPKAESQPAGDLLKAIDLDQVEPIPAVQPAVTASRLSAEPTPESLPAGWLQGVSVGKRVSAAAMDAALMLGLNAAIVWFTLAICGMPAAQARLLPLIPLAVFFLLVDGGYLVLFTAACGQTIGKMAAGIRVVGTSTSAVINDRISIGQAVARAISTFASCLPLGAGFWVALFGDGRALHDRVAHTRVVRA